VNAFPSKVVTDIIFGHYQTRSAQRRRTTLRSKFGWTTLPFVRNKGLYRQPARNDSVRIVALTPDGRRAVSGGDQTLRLWDLESAQCLRMLEGHTGGGLGRCHHLCSRSFFWPISLVCCEAMGAVLTQGDPKAARGLCSPAPGAYSKSGVRVTVPWVRIPPLPPQNQGLR
jgi:WD40 repeat protein